MTFGRGRPPLPIPNKYGGKMRDKIKEETDNLIKQMIKVIEDWSDKSDDKNSKKHNALRRFGLQKYYKERSNADR